MPGKLGFGVLAALVGLVVGLSVHGVAALPASAAPRTFTVVLDLREGEGQAVDLTPPGVSQGDVRVFTHPLLDAEATKVIGRNDGVCTGTDPADAPDEQAQGNIVQCLVTYSLPDGVITAQGVHSGATHSLESSPGTTRIRAITGGTGKYQTARGGVVIEMTPQEQEAELIPATFYVLLDP
jgi:hypothetical protein